MIWHNEIITIPDQPPNSSISLVGIYEARIAVIRLDIQGSPEETIQQIILFSHPPGLAHEEPTKADVMEKHGVKLTRFRNKVLRTPFLSLRKL